MNKDTLRQWPWMPIIVVVVVLTIVVCIPLRIPTGDDVTIPTGEPDKPIGMLTRDITVTQQFPATGTTIRSIALQFGTYRRVNPGTLSVSLLGYEGARWRTVFSQQLATETLGDNEFATLTLNPPVTVMFDQPLRLTVQSQADPAHAVTWWVNPTYQSPGYSLFVNGKPEPGTARFAVSFVPRHGPLITLISPLLARVTILLNGAQRALLIIATAILLASIAALGRRLPDRAPTKAASLAVDSEADTAILRPVATSGAPAPHSGQEDTG